MKTSVRSRISWLLLVSLVVTLLGSAFMAVGVSAADDPKENNNEELKVLSANNYDVISNFIDVTTETKYYDAIKFVCENGLFIGTSDTTFEPETYMTRSMFATVLARAHGADVSKYVTPTFPDVLPGQWYTSYVEWAAANGAVKGYDNGLYGVNDSITVEQACVIMARYYGYKNVKASGKTLADFNDSESISSWATDAVKWAVENSIYEGEDSSLFPTAPATRALVASMFKNFVFICIYGK